MKLVSWNVEDARRVLDDLPALVERLGSPDVLCLQELRIRAQDAADVAALEAALPGWRCFHSLPRDPRNVTFRGGRMYGVATFARGRWRGERPAWDVEGRVVVVRRAGLAIVNVYAVNGTAKPWYDASGRAAGDRHALKRHFQAQLFALGADLARDADVVMAGDWNVSRRAEDTHPRLRTEAPHAQARAELNAALSAHGFVDIWREQHPAQRAYTWFNRRARGLDAARVDYVLVSSGLAARVRTSEIMDLLPQSDHAPVRIELAPARR
jgi:exodeoxyribonuclease-3